MELGWLGFFGIRVAEHSPSTPAPPFPPSTDYKSMTCSHTLEVLLLYYQELYSIFFVVIKVWQIIILPLFAPPCLTKAKSTLWHPTVLYRGVPCYGLYECVISMQSSPFVIDTRLIAIHTWHSLSTINTVHSTRYRCSTLAINDQLFDISDPSMFWPFDLLI